MPVGEALTALHRRCTSAAVMALKKAVRPCHQFLFLVEQCDIDESDLQCFWECHLWNVNVDESVSGLEMGELPFSSGTLSSIRRDLVLMSDNCSIDFSISSLEKE